MERVVAVAATLQERTGEKQGDSSQKSPKTGLLDAQNCRGSRLSHSDEYKMLREEIMHHIETQSREQIWAVVGAGAVYTWVVTHRELMIGPWRYAWFIAPVIIFACALHNLELSYRVNHIAGYLRRIEAIEFPQDADAPGWEHYKRRHRLSDLFGASLGILLWGVAVVGSFAVSWYCLSLPSLPPSK